MPVLRYETILFCPLVLQRTTINRSVLKGPPGYELLGPREEEGFQRIWRRFPPGVCLMCPLSGVPMCTEDV